VMQPDDGCNDLANRCDLSQSDIYTNRVQIFWLEEGDLRRAVIGFPKIHHWYTGEKYEVANPIRYNPKDGKIYQLTEDRRFLQFSLFQDEKGEWRWRILPEKETSYLEDRREEVKVEMEALGERTGFFGQGEWEEVERKTYPKLNEVETVVYRVLEAGKTESGYLVVEAKAPAGDESYYFLIVAQSPDRDIGPITTEEAQKRMVDFYARLVAYSPPEILELVYRYGNAVGIYVETYEEQKERVGYDFDPVNPGSRNAPPVVLFRQLRIGPKGEPRDPQADFIARLNNKIYENDTLVRLIVEPWEMRSYVQFNPKMDQRVEDARGLKIVDRETYRLLMAIINGNHHLQRVMPPEEALITVFDTNPMVNAFLQQYAYWLGMEDSAYPPPQIKRYFLEAARSDIFFYAESYQLGFHPPFSSTP